MGLNISKHSLVVIFSVAFILFANSCLAEFKYEGDGLFHDYGNMASSDRYVLDLGKVDLSSREEKNLTIGDLPNSQTLGLYLYFDIDEARASKVDFWKKYVQVEIHLTIKVIGSEESAFEYKGVLWEDGVSEGSYYRKGLMPVETTFRGKECIGFTVPYYFDEKMEVLGLKTPFYENHKRIISLKVLKPIEKNTFELEAAENVGVVADLVITGGDW